MPPAADPGTLEGNAPQPGKLKHRHQTADARPALHQGPVCSARPARSTETRSQTPCHRGGEANMPNNHTLDGARRPFSRAARALLAAASLVLLAPVAVGAAAPA